MISALTLEVRPGESVSIGRGVTMTVARKSGQVTRLQFLVASGITIKKLDYPTRTGPQQARHGIPGM